jgi:WD40 repeat protein
MTEVRSIQLSVRGKPSAFDLSVESNMIVVASPGCFTFFDLDGMGVPAHFIHYEHPQQVRRVRYQTDGSLAVLRGGAVSLWDPAHSLRPLLGFIQDSGWITNLEWSSSNSNILSTCCDVGDAKIWDARSANQPVMSIHLGGICQKISWSRVDANHLAVSNLNKVSVFDTRMVGANNVVSVYEPPEGLLQFAWCAKGHQTLLAVLPDGTLEWRNALDGTRDSVSAPNVLDEASLLFPTPVGKGAVVCRYEYVGNTQQSQPFNGRAGPTQSTSLSASNLTSKNDLIPKPDAPRKVVVNLIGYGGPSEGRPSDGNRRRVEITESLVTEVSRVHH